MKFQKGYQNASFAFMRRQFRPIAYTYKISRVGGNAPTGDTSWAVTIRLSALKSRTPDEFAQNVGHLCDRISALGIAVSHCQAIAKPSAPEKTIIIMLVTRVDPHKTVRL